MPQSFDDDEEKTTIESSWEEEASTTVEQGEVAEKIRALGLPRGNNNITNVTSTSNSLLDEPTVDDQRANAALSIITPQAILARLVITHGNDTGQEVEVVPGKNYTIGRAVDNDVVLTDIAVSRKHFDLRHEKGGWVLADRGSGNGTLVNGNLEDQPFTLANGDQIEIGNTTFRFDHPNGTPRNIAQTFDVDLDEEEPSTVAGKPLRDEGPTPAQIPPPQILRPKTVPPPAPLPRPRTQSSAPPDYPHPQRISQQRPVTAGPNGYQAMAHQHPGMAALQAPSASAAGTMPIPGHRVPMLGAHAPTMLAGDLPLQNVMPTTIPGQGPPMAPSQPMMQFYPNPSDLHAQMMVASNMPGRDPTSTALVQPTPYSGIPSMPPPTYVAPQLSRRTKLILGGAGLALLAAITTVAIIKSSSSTASSATPPRTGSNAKPQIAPISEAKPELAKVEPKLEANKPELKVTPKAEPTIPTAPEPTVEPKIEAKKVETAKPEPKIEAKKVETAKPEPKIEAKKPEPKVEIAKPEREVKKEPKVEPKREVKKEPKVEPKREKKEKRVAAADTADARSKADSLYRSKRFNDAASALRSAAGSVGDGDAKDLKSLAAVYEQLGKAYNLGMASSTSPDSAFKQLQVALNMENSAGGAFKDEIRAKLSSVAPRAALSFISNKDYSAAAAAVRIAEQNGSTSSTKLVRTQLEGRAKELYDQAAKELDANPSEAKAKLKQIKGLVDSKSPWYQKAEKLLSGL